MYRPLSIRMKNNEFSHLNKINTSIKDEISNFRNNFNNL